jgi:hypothetical protein
MTSEKRPTVVTIVIGRDGDEPSVISGEMPNHVSVVIGESYPKADHAV